MPGRTCERCFLSALGCDKLLIATCKEIQNIQTPNLPVALVGASMHGQIQRAASSQPVMRVAESATPRIRDALGGWEGSSQSPLASLALESSHFLS